MFENKKIFVLGMARSGYEVSKLLSHCNNDILITDKKEQDESRVEELEKLGVKFIKTDDPVEFLDKSFDYVVKNPGIRYDHPLILKAKEMGIKVINEVEVAYHFLPKDTFIIAITGSNGKTTTTTLCYEFIKKMGKRVHIGGNIGYPLSGLVSDIKAGDILVIEISVQQLYDLYDFNPNIAILTNLTPVHIDLAGSYEKYIDLNSSTGFDEAEITIENNAKDSMVISKIYINNYSHFKCVPNIAVINKSNIDSYKNTMNISSKKIYFSSVEKADAYINGTSIFYNDEKIIDLSDIKIKGNHNYENIMCAIIAAKELKITNKDIKAVLNNFSGVEHRLEYVCEKNGVNFYNDSKATNVKSTQIALDSFNTPVILILGGLDRGHSFEDLKDYLKNVKNIVCYGETKNRIKDFADSVGINCTVFDNLEETTKFCYKIAEPGDTILLSPACASWDQYNSFEERGEKFKEIISMLN